MLKKITGQLRDEVANHSAKFLEEIKEDIAKMKEIVEDSSSDAKQSR